MSGHFRLGSVFIKKNQNRFKPTGFVSVILEQKPVFPVWLGSVWFFQLFFFSFLGFLIFLLTLNFYKLMKIFNQFTTLTVKIKK
jgi:hypothetical protein